MPLHSDVHIDRPLSNFAVDYKNKKFIASLVAPFVPVNNKSDSYIIFNKEDKFSLPEDLRGPKSHAKEVTWGSSSSTYGCIDRALRDFLSDAIVANSDQGINPQQRTTNFLTDLLLLKYEKRVVDLVTTYANYGASYRTTLSGTSQLSDFAGSDPIDVIDTAKSACFIEPNTIIMSKEVFDKLKRHPQLLDHVKGGSNNTSPAKVNAQTMAEIFEVDQILIGEAKYNSSVKGQTASYSSLWGKHIIVAYVAPDVSMESVTAWKTFRWNQVSTGAGFKVRRYRDESVGGGGEWIEVEMSVVEKAICSDLAYMVKDAIA